MVRITPKYDKKKPPHLVKNGITNNKSVSSSDTNESLETILDSPDINKLNQIFKNENHLKSIFENKQLFKKLINNQVTFKLLLENKKALEQLFSNPTFYSDKGMLDIFLIDKMKNYNENKDVNIESSKIYKVFNSEALTFLIKNEYTLNYILNCIPQYTFGKETKQNDKKLVNFIRMKFAELQNNTKNINLFDNKNKSETREAKKILETLPYDLKNINYNEIEKSNDKIIQYANRVLKIFQKNPNTYHLLSDLQRFKTQYQLLGRTKHQKKFDELIIKIKFIIENNNNKHDNTIYKAALKEVEKALLKEKNSPLRTFLNAISLSKSHNFHSFGLFMNKNPNEYHYPRMLAMLLKDNKEKIKFTEDTKEIIENIKYKK